MPYTDDKRAEDQTEMLLSVADDSSAAHHSSAAWLSGVVQLSQMGARAVPTLHREVERQNEMRLRTDHDEHSSNYRRLRFTAAVRALGMIGHPTTLPILHSVLPASLEGRSEDRYSSRRASTAEYHEILLAIERYGDPESTSHIAGFLARFMRERPEKWTEEGTTQGPERFKAQEEAARALQVLAKLGGEAALSTLMEHMWLLEKPTAVLSDALAGFGDALEEKLWTLTADSDASRRTVAFEALHGSRSAKSLELATAALATETGATLRAAYDLVKTRQEKRSADALEEFLDTALEAKAWPVQERYRRNEPAAWRGQHILADALGLYAHLAGQASVPLLLRFAACESESHGRDSRPRELIIAFGRDAVPALQARVTNDDPAIAHTAATLMTRITQTKAPKAEARSW